MNPIIYIVVAFLVGLAVIPVLLCVAVFITRNDSDEPREQQFVP